MPKTLIKSAVSATHLSTNSTLYYTAYPAIISSSSSGFNSTVLSLECMRGRASLTRRGRCRDPLSPHPPLSAASAAPPPCTAAVELFLSLPSLFPVHSMEGQRAQIIAPECLQGDHSGRLQPPVDLVLTVLAANGPLLQLPTAQAG